MEDRVSIVYYYLPTTYQKKAIKTGKHRIMTSLNSRRDKTRSYRSGHGLIVYAVAHIRSHMLEFKWPVGLFDLLPWIQYEIYIICPKNGEGSGFCRPQKKFCKGWENLEVVDGVLRIVFFFPPPLQSLYSCSFKAQYLDTQVLKLLKSLPYSLLVIWCLFCYLAHLMLFYLNANFFSGSFS